MAKNSVVVQDPNPSLNFALMFLVMALVNAVVIYLANMFFPNQVVLGTISVSHTWAVILSSSALSLLTLLVYPLLKWWELRQKRALSPQEMMAAYLVINFVGLWLVTRVSEIFGLGLSSWLVVLVLAAVLDFVQGMAGMAMDNMTKGK